MAVLCVNYKKSINNWLTIRNSTVKIVIVKTRSDGLLLQDGRQDQISFCCRVYDKEVSEPITYKGVL